MSSLNKAKRSVVLQHAALHITNLFSLFVRQPQYKYPLEPLLHRLCFSVDLLEEQSACVRSKQQRHFYPRDHRRHPQTDPRGPSQNSQRPQTYPPSHSSYPGPLPNPRLHTPLACIGASKWFL
eukprot:GHVQ01008188.1.p1 GENE.GHVQ01008188.1~~GHVQ01008188.1.p1  ORF type:complete len:123 (+),score=7.50 GHVQ01008188.1:777-1145(+)